jgi:methionine aminopeptidase
MQQQDLSSPGVSDKYKAAADIASKALGGVVAICRAGASVVELCEFGDSVVDKMCAAAAKASKVDAGVAFPTCVSVNEIAGSFSPLKGHLATIKAGDVVKMCV